MSSSLVFDSVNENISPFLTDSIGFGTVGYDAFLNTNIKYSGNHVTTTIFVQDPNAIHHICYIEKTQLIIF